MVFLERLAARRVLGIKPGLETIRQVMSCLGDVHKNLRAIHIAGTNGKGATAAIIDASLRAAGFSSALYTSPHLVRLNERFTFNGQMLSDAELQLAASQVERVATDETTFFEALTATAFLAFSLRKPDFVVLETGLGGRLDATNICSPCLTIITRIGLDHCHLLGSTVEQIAQEKSGIIKPGIPIILGENTPQVREVVAAQAEKNGAPFYYAPDIVSLDDIPSDFPLKGTFNRENAQTAFAALNVLSNLQPSTFNLQPSTFNLRPSTFNLTWPGRFQRIGKYLVDGAHNPPAFAALARSLREVYPNTKWTLIAGFCADKSIPQALEAIAPLVSRALAVKTTNPRSISPEELASLMTSCGIAATACATLDDALDATLEDDANVLICGSLFLAGEALVRLNAYPCQTIRFDPSELP